MKRHFILLMTAALCVSGVATADDRPCCPQSASPWLEIGLRIQMQAEGSSLAPWITFEETGSRSAEPRVSLRIAAGGSPTGQAPTTAERVRRGVVIVRALARTALALVERCLRELTRLSAIH